MLQVLRDTAKTAGLTAVGLAGYTGFSGFPDRDIALLGIGSHRFFLFHSGAAIKGLEKMYMNWYELDDRNTIERMAKKVVGVALGGAAIGMGVHLLSNTLNPKAVIFPLIGSLVDGTMVDDTLWLLANSIWCFKMGANVITLVAADDVAKAKELMLSLLSGVRRQWLATS